MAIADMVFNPPTGLNDATYSPQTPANEASARSEIQGVSDQLRDYINSTLIPQIVALNIPITAITDLDGANLQTIIQSIRDKLKATADGSSGADYVNATAINGLVGTTVQTLLEALKTYVDTHKTSSDHDTRYYTKDQLQSITTGSSGADIIKSTPISANSGNTVQAQLAWLLTQIAIAATGAIPDGSIGQEKLTSLLSTKIDTALSNTGLLATLLTTDKSSSVNAINEIFEDITTYMANYMSYASAKVEDVYTVVDFKRADNTLYLKSTLSNPDTNGYFQTCTLNYYDNVGTTIINTVTWTFTYDTDGNIITKVVV